MTESDISVRRSDQNHRYEVWEGDQIAGYTEIRQDGPGRLSMLHTAVVPSYRGRGLAGVLVGQALADAAARGETVVPHCLVVRGYLQRHEVPGLQVDWPDA